MNINSQFKSSNLKKFDNNGKTRYQRWLENNKIYDDEAEDIASENENWLDVMLPYSDLMSLLLVFFIFFYIFHTMSSASNVTTEARKELSQVVSQTIPVDSSQTVIEKEKLDIFSKNAQDTMGGEKEHLFRISGEILFASGSSELKQEATSMLRLIGQQIKSKVNDDPNWQIRIEGHTDNIPISTKIFQSNWDLSTARAVSVVRFYIENFIFMPDQLQAMGYGEFNPVASNSTEWGRRQNRRVEIKLSYKKAG